MKRLKELFLVAGATVSTLPLMFPPACAAASLGENIDPGAGFAPDIGRLINAILSFVMVIAALLVFIYLIWGGIEWITSGGDKGKTENARNKITSAIIGLIVLAASYAILQLALNFLGFEGGIQELFGSGFKTISD